MDESYHPSEGAHNANPLPPMQTQQNEPAQTPASESGREERKEAYEAAARKMDVDEDYDDEPEEEKRKKGSGGSSSPQRSTLNGQMTAEEQI